ncbi:MAG: hypothetical protein HYT94_04870 [Parcubacteria group bacterium]|nr:hypothetical protein [Parcubacteria group bacterium]
MNVTKTAEALFTKKEEQTPSLSTYMVFQEFCKNMKFGRLGLEQHFFALVDTEDYEISEEDWKEQSSDKEFRKKYPSAKAYNEEMQLALIDRIFSRKDAAGKTKTAQPSAFATN